MPAYRASATIREALESVLAQTFPVTEVLVVDDGSDDDTAAIAEGYGAPVRVLSQRNQGTAAARNRGIQQSVGDVICFLDADDRYEPGRIEAIASKFAGEPDLDGVLTDTLLIQPDGHRLASGWWPPEASRERLDLRAKVIFCALALRKRVLDEVGPFDSGFKLLEDVEMWNRLLCRGYAIGYVDDPSYVYVINAEGKTQSAHRVRGEGELARIHLRYALALRTPHQWRTRLLVRAFRHGRRSFAARFR